MLEHNQFKEYLVREIDELQETQKQMKARFTGGNAESFSKKKGAANHLKIRWLRPLS